jgi:hypothetical protein
VSIRPCTVGSDGTHGIGSRVWLAPVSLVIAPILGIWAGGSMPNPPGNGPGTGQVVVGVAVPVCLTFVASVVARGRTLEASIWALASVALTGGLILFLAYFVEYVIRPA